MKDCLPSAKVLLPFFQTPFLGLQTYLLWAHSKDCIHIHMILTRSGLMLILCTDILLWLSAVTEDSVHMEIELEKDLIYLINFTDQEDDGNSTDCNCGRQLVCPALRKGYEVLYPFNMEFSLLAGCMLYVMWKNVGRHTTAPHSGHSQKITLRILCYGGILLGPVLGLLVLISGVVIFVLYQVWVGQRGMRIKAFMLFYGFHLGVMPLMALCAMAGTAGRSAKNPTRRLDVFLLVGSGLGQLFLSYSSLVAALAMGPSDVMESLDLSYSLLSLLELVLQNVFIIQGLQDHKHFGQKRAEKETSEGSVGFKLQRVGRYHIKTLWIKNGMSLKFRCLWVIPAFGAHPQFESGVGKQFYGFFVWFVLVNLGQPLIVFYRMHSVGALMELLILA
uniref:Otopetrin 3 n=1 Tax=Pygocentrus nattereri TaxID=42514 RepID=A0AAR2JSR8_PYGNA